MRYCECTTFAPATIIAPVVNLNVKYNPNSNPNPNPNPNLNSYPTLNYKPNHLPQSNSLLSEISQEQLSLEQMSDHRYFSSYLPKYSLLCNE